MSTQGGGAVTGLAVGCIELGLYLAGKATVLAAKGVLYIGKGLYAAYKEHERRVEERLKKQEQAASRLEALHKALSQMENQLKEDFRRVEETVSSDSVEFSGRLARELSGRKRKIVQEKETAQRLEAELEATVAKLQAVQAQRPEVTSSSLFPADALRQIEEKEKPLKEQAEKIEERLASYSSLREHLDQQSQAAVLTEAEEILATLPSDKALQSRLGSSKTGGTLKECEQLLREIYLARRQLSTEQDANEAQKRDLSQRLITAHLIVENLRCLADGERKELLKYPG